MCEEGRHVVLAAGRWLRGGPPVPFGLWADEMAGDFKVVRLVYAPPPWNLDGSEFLQGTEEVGRFKTLGAALVAYDRLWEKEG